MKSPLLSSNLTLRFHCSFKELVYEGVPDDVVTGAEPADLNESTPRKRSFMGGNGSQTLTIPCIDAFLGIEHAPGSLS